MRAAKRGVNTAACALILFAVVFAILGGGASLAFADTGTVTFYLDNKETPYASVEIEEGSFTVPENLPYKEGVTFDCWSDGLAKYYPGNTYTVNGSIELHALWVEEEDIYRRPPLFNKTEKIALYITLGVLGVLFLFCYYWFGIKQYGVKDLGARIKKIFSKKKL